MPITSATSATPSLANFTSSTTPNARVPSHSLGEADFLKLLSVQFQQQDPMKPMDDTTFIAQTAQFTSLQQMTQLNQQQQMMTGTGYLGRNVTVQNPQGQQLTGLVTALDNSGTEPAIVINGISFPMTYVKRIEPASTPPTTPVSTTTTPAPATTTTG
jgi:flagellar basal-body rod modification protein FlgD